MSALNSHFLLIDLHNSWHSATQIPSTTLAYFNAVSKFSTFSATNRRTGGRHGRISSSNLPVESIRSPEIRRPRDNWSAPGNGLVSVSSSSVSTSGSESVPELNLFLELVPLRMRNELYGHQEIGDLIEIVMDLGRVPLARFPSGDWVISEQPVKLEDLEHAISKVSENDFNNGLYMCT